MLKLHFQMALPVELFHIICSHVLEFTDDCYRTLGALYLMGSKWPETVRNTDAFKILICVKDITNISKRRDNLWQDLVTATDNVHLAHVLYYYSRKQRDMLFDRRQSLLDLACSVGHLNMSRLFFSLFKPNEYQKMAQTIYADNGQLELLKLIDNTGAVSPEDLRSIFMYACVGGQCDIIGWIIDKHPLELSSCALDGIRNACGRGYLEVVCLLAPFVLRYATCDRYEQEVILHSPFTWACIYGHINVARFLFEHYPNDTLLNEDTIYFHSVLLETHLIVVLEWLFSIIPSEEYFPTNRPSLTEMYNRWKSTRLND